MDDLEPWNALDDEADSLEEEEILVELNGDQEEENNGGYHQYQEAEELQFEDEEWKLEEEFQDELQEEFEELQHLVQEQEVVKEGDSEEEEVVKGRETDLKLTDVPEDMREAVQGSLSLKRILNEKYGSLDESASKRRRLEEEPEMEPERRELLDRWKLTYDPAVRYVIQTADLDDVLEVGQTTWSPNFKGVQMRNGRDPKSVAEQVHEKLLEAREQKLLSREMVNVIEAWKARWKLKDEDIKPLASASHKDLRYVMREYNGSRGVLELLEDASAHLAPEDSDKTEDALPDLPGLFTVSRFNRLELIDSVADALVVGDANLTFSALLAEHREGLGHVGRLVATTFETIEILRERYSEIDQTVKSLEDKMSEVLHNVDGTRLAVDPRFKGMENKFGAVYYNFPHAGVVQGFFDGHPFVRWRHENLMHLFFRALRGFVKKGGIVKVASNAFATGVRFSDIIIGAQKSEFVHIETFPFLEWQLRNYGRSYGDRRDRKRRPEDGEIYRSQRAQSDMVYCFRYEPSGDIVPKAMIRFPPSKDQLMGAKEGRLQRMSSHDRERRVQEIYEIFLTYVQGVHVG